MAASVFASGTPCGSPVTAPPSLATPVVSELGARSTSQRATRKFLLLLQYSEGSREIFLPR